MSDQDVQVQDLLRPLSSLASDLERLVERSPARLASAPVASGENTKDFGRHKAFNSPVRLNVGGEVWTASWGMMSARPGSRLGRLSAASSLEEALAHCDGYNPLRNEFFFSRRSRNFAELLDFYRNGTLHIRKHLMRL